MGDRESVTAFRKLQQKLNKMGGSLQLNIAHKMQLKYIGQGDRLKYDGGRPDLTCEMCDSPTSQSVSVFFPRKTNKCR